MAFQMVLMPEPSVMENRFLSSEVLVEVLRTEVLEDASGVAVAPELPKRRLMELEEAS